MSQVGGPLALVYLAINAGVTVNVDVWWGGLARRRQQSAGVS